MNNLVNGEECIRSSECKSGLCTAGNLCKQRKWLDPCTASDECPQFHHCDSVLKRCVQHDDIKRSGEDCQIESHCNPNAFCLPSHGKCYTRHAEGKKCAELMDSCVEGLRCRLSVCTPLCRTVADCPSKEGMTSLCTEQIEKELKLKYCTYERTIKNKSEAKALYNPVIVIIVIAAVCSIVAAIAVVVVCRLRGRKKDIAHQSMRG
jgi:hypothetical protein